MLDIFRKYGLVQPAKVEAAERLTQDKPIVLGVPIGGSYHKRKLTRNWKTLLTLSQSPIPSRAITLIRDKVSGLEYTITPRKGLEDEDFEDEIEIVRSVLENPNIEDEDFATFIGPIVEDNLVFDSGVWEYVERPRFIEGNELLGLFPVPGWSIERAKKWDGDPHQPRWAQVVGNSQKSLPLLDSQIEVLIHRKRASLPYGFSPTETVVGLMDSWLGLASYQSEKASNAYPDVMVSLGKNADQTKVDAWKGFWNNELQGRGQPAFFGNTDDPKLIQLKTSGDDGLYLKYYEQLVRTIAFVYKLKPQDFGVERDVNRGQGEVSQSASIEEAIKPYASLIRRRINNRVIARIAIAANNPRIRDLVFNYPNINPWDEKEQQEVLDARMDHDGLLMSEYRAEIGREPFGDERDDMTLSEYKVSIGFDVTPRNPDDVDPDVGATLTGGVKKKNPHRSMSTRRHARRI